MLLDEKAQTDLIQNPLCRVDLVGDVRVGMQAKHLGNVLKANLCSAFFHKLCHLDWQVGDELAVLLHSLAVRQGVTIIKLESSDQKLVVEPHIGERVEQPFVKVVSDSTPVLDLGQHELSRRR